MPLSQDCLRWRLSARPSVGTIQSCVERCPPRSGSVRILERYEVRRQLKVKCTVRPEHTFRQTRRGRPGPNVAYRRVTRHDYEIEWTLDQPAVS